MKQASFKSAIFYLTLVFLVGVLVGATGYHFYEVRARASGEKRHDDRKDFHQWYLEKMKRELQLDEEQLKQLDGILSEARKEYHRVWEEVRPKLDEIYEKRNEKIRSILRPEQHQLFEKFIEKERSRGGRGRGKPPGGKGF